MSIKEKNSILSAPYIISKKALASSNWLPVKGEHITLSFIYA